MRKPSKVFAAGRMALAVLALIGSAVLISAPKPPFTAQDKAYYADPNLVNFVRPGLQFDIVSAEILQDGTIRTRIRVTDPRGLGLDRLGVTTPGNVAMTFLAGYVPANERQYVSYVNRTQVSPITGTSARQPAGENNGQWAQVGDGEYTYTFSNRAPATIDRNATHTIGVYGSRNLSEFDLGTDYDDDVFHFIPAGGAAAAPRDVVDTSTCNKCHYQLAAHGGTRRSMQLCVLCHTKDVIDPDTGESVDMAPMTHRIHAGEELPSVQAGRPYRIYGNQQSLHDYSTVVFPADIRNCDFCHEQRAPDGRTPAQANTWMTHPNRKDCGSCHDNVNFATGENHAGLPQLSDNQCSNCHQPQGELPLDISIVGGHMIPEVDVPKEGINLEILNVSNTQAGQRPTVTFRVTNDAGQPIPAPSLVGGFNRLALLLGGPVHEYGYTSFGSDVTTSGYVSEDATRATCAGDGTCTYTFQRAIPADAKGTYAVSIEGRRDLVILPGTQKELHTEYGGINKVSFFSVDNSPVVPRRVNVTIEKCNQCHGFLRVHGENRNQIQTCVICHNASETDIARRRVTANEAEKNRPPQAIDMAVMIHKIHTGERMHEFQRDYTVIGFGGSVNPFDEVRYPVLRKNGQAADTSVCTMCHVNGSEGLPLANEQTRPQQVDPQGPLNPVGRVTAACTSCHQSLPAASHALANTTTLGESCSACHGQNSQFSVQRVHAR